MVLKLTASDCVPAIVNCVEAMKPFAHYYALSDSLFLAEKWQNLMSVGMGKAYALPAEKGILLGMVVPDLLTARAQGIVYLWLALPGQGRKPLALLRAFEEDCVKEKVSMLVAGCSVFWDMDRRERLYKRLGYSPYGKSFFKELA
jgi:hypothetical protein